MEYQKIIKLLDNTPNQPTKFSTKSWVDINDEERGINNTNSQIRFKTSMLKPKPNNNDKEVVFKNCAPFTDCISISEINNTQIDNVKYIDVIMPMYKLIEHSDNYSKTSGSL